MCIRDSPDMAENQLERVLTRSGSDCTADSRKYMWLKRFLASRGCSADRLSECFGPDELQELGFELGYLTLEQTGLAEDLDRVKEGYTTEPNSPAAEDGTDQAAPVPGSVGEDCHDCAVEGEQVVLLIVADWGHSSSGMRKTGKVMAESAE
eukprot:TRINITY_DN29074_c0_g1_i1.p1 TRINITY_DN29074_c0_g1~~TRINITY_DN29074_c0_g1_i1.p1  ORF type:complete len:151 (+),score=42.97 TRINITY_DN29074_c0_g1_i1:59-511(+)